MLSQLIVIWANMPCSWANREAHIPQTKTWAKSTQTTQLFHMSIPAGMQLGGQNASQRLQKPVFPCPVIYTFLHRAKLPGIFCSVGDGVKAIKHGLQRSWAARQPRAWQLSSHTKRDGERITHILLLLHLLSFGSVLHCSKSMSHLFCMHSPLALQGQ